MAHLYKQSLSWPMLKFSRWVSVLKRLNLQKPVIRQYILTVKLTQQNTAFQKDAGFQSVNLSLFFNKNHFIGFILNATYISKLSRISGNHSFLHLAHSKQFLHARHCCQYVYMGYLINPVTERSILCFTEKLKSAQLLAIQK